MILGTLSLLVCWFLGLALGVVCGELTRIQEIEDSLERLESDAEKNSSQNS